MVLVVDVVGDDDRRALELVFEIFIFFLGKRKGLVIRKGRLGEAGLEVLVEFGRRRVLKHAHHSTEGSTLVVVVRIVIFGVVGWPGTSPTKAGTWCVVILVEWWC